jgi:hypothetical protein
MLPWRAEHTKAVTLATSARRTASATTEVASDEHVLAIEPVLDSDETADRRSSLNRLIGRGRGPVSIHIHH